MADMELLIRTLIISHYMHTQEVILFFGSYNPVHNGHTSVARYVVSQGLCDELWFVVSPQNPHKLDSSLAPGDDRLRMTEIAVGELLAGQSVKVSDIEFLLPKPSYTIDTLRVLEERHPCTKFSLLAGTDIMENMCKWKEAESLLAQYRFYVYPRPGYPYVERARDTVFLKDAPVWNQSSTDIRKALLGGEDVSAMIAPGVLDYINRHGLWSPEKNTNKL